MLTPVVLTDKEVAYMVDVIRKPSVEKFQRASKILASK